MTNWRQLFWWSVLAFAMSFGFVYAVLARDLGQYVQASPELRQWFGTLHNQSKQLCCADADGYDAQWDTSGNSYRVFSPEGWVVVPPEAIIDVPNKAMVAKVWWAFDKGKRTVRCFIPGLQV